MGAIPGSSKSRTSRIPFSMSSNLPGFARSSRETRLCDRLPPAAAPRASSMSRALAARMSSLEASRPSWMASRASLRSWAESVARASEADLASRAADEGSALVRDMAGGRAGGPDGDGLVGSRVRVVWGVELGFQGKKRDVSRGNYWSPYKVQVSRWRGRFLSQFGGGASN